MRVREWLGRQVVKELETRDRQLLGRQVVKELVTRASPVPPKTVPRGTVAQTPKRQRTYEQSYIQYGFTSVMESNEEKPKCLLCSKVLSSESMKPSKLKRHLATTTERACRQTQSFLRK